MKLVFCLIYFFSYMAFGQDLPQIFTNSGSVNKFGNFPLTANLAYKDNNLGRYVKEFGIPLPMQNPVVRKNLLFNYNSNLKHNLGLGYGFSLNLPQLIFDKGSIRGAILISDHYGVSELIDYDNGLVEKDIHSFVKVIKTNDIYIATYPDGKEYTFNKYGELTKERTSFQNNIIDYIWLKHRLSEVNISGLGLKFEYIDCKIDIKKIARAYLPFVYQGKWYDSKKCLNEITYSRDQNKIIFKYNTTGNLNYVSWDKGEEFPIFNAKYSNETIEDDTILYSKDISKNGEVAEDSIALNKGKNGIHFVSYEELLAKNKINTLIGIRTIRSGNVGMLLPFDINNDGYTDYLTIYKHWNAAQYRDRKGRNYKIVKEGSWDKIQTVAHVWSKEKSRYIKDSQLSQLPIEEIFKLGVYRNKGDKNRKYGYYDAMVELQMENLVIDIVPKISDLNGDGRLDVLFCGKNSFYILNTNDGYKKYSIKKDCSKKTILVDLNKDGRSDLVDEGNIFINNHLLNFVKDDTKQFENLKNIVSNGNSSLFEFGNTGHIVDLKKSERYFLSDINNDGDVERWSINDKAPRLYRPYINIPLMTKITLPSQGKINIGYTRCGSSVCVSSYKVDNLQKNGSVKYKYIYMQRQIDIETNKFMGFRIVNKIKLPALGVKGKSVVKVYFKENKALSNTQRTVYHGLLVKKFVCKYKNCEKLIRKLKNNEVILSNDGQEKIITHKYQLINESGLKQYPANSYFLMKNETMISVLNSPINKKEEKLIVQGLIHKKEVVEMSMLGPLVIKNIKKDNHFDIGFSMNRMNRLYNEKLKINKIINNKLKVSNVTESSIGPNLKVNTIKVTKYDYLGKEGKDDYTIMTIKGLGEKIKSSKVIFDKSGRYSKKNDEWGNETLYSYIDRLSPQIKKGERTDYCQKSIFGQILKCESWSENKSKVLSEEMNYNKSQMIKSYKYGNIEYLLEYERNKHGITIVRYQKNNDTTLNKVDSHYFDGVGQLIYSDSYADISKKLNIMNAEGFLINQIRRKNGINKLYQQYIYDYQGRLLNDINIDENFKREFRHDGACVKSYENGIKIKEECRDLSNELISYEKGDEFIFHKSQSTGDTVELGDLRFIYNLSGDQIATVDFKKNILQRMKKDFQDKKIYKLEGSLSLNNLSMIDSIHDHRDTLLSKFIYDDLNHLTQVENQVGTSEYHYNDFNQLVSKKITHNSMNNSIKLLFSYDSRGRVLEEKSKKYLYKYIYSNNTLDKITPILKKIIRDENGLISQGHFSNGVIFSYSRNSSGILEEIQSNNGFSEKYVYTDFKKLKSKKMNKTREVKYNYNRVNQIVAPMTKESSFRNNKRQVINKDVVFNKAGYISSLEGKLLMYKNHEQLLSYGDETYLEKNIHYINKHFVRYVFVEGLLLGAYISGENINGFFPILTDYQGSVRVIYGKDGRILENRNYDFWGNYQSAKSAKKYKQASDYIRKDFAGLVRPLGSAYLISNTRIYSPRIGEWLTMDKELLRNPSKFINGHLDEIDGVSYAAGDPVNFVDPSGQFAIPAMVVGGIMGGLFGGTAGAIGALATNSNVWRGMAVGFITGASIGSGASLVAGLTGMGAIAAQGAIGSIFGFTGNLVGQAGITGKVDIAQSFVAGIGGGMTTSFSAALGQSFNGFAKDLGVGVSYMSTDIGLSLTTDRFGSDSFGNSGNSGFNSFSNSGDYNFGGSSSNSNDYWSSNPY